MRVLVCGGRNYDDKAKLEAELDKLNPKLVIHGGCSGADTLAEDWAWYAGVKTIVFAYEHRFGKAGGPIRNAKMLELSRPDLVLAFPGGKGTADMVRRAEQAGVQVRRVE